MLDDAIRTYYDLGLEQERLASSGEGTRMVLRSEFDPAGPVGHAYWWSNLAAHRVVFSLLADRWASLLSE